VGEKHTELGRGGETKERERQTHRAVRRGGEKGEGERNTELVGEGEKRRGREKHAEL
jgi:hypothetical protein